jgi:8-oxo-dGTP pyrophosphatase MutT (NUDIX family)
MINNILKLSNLFYKTAKLFWGKQASGLIIICNEDNTILLCKRASDVEDPNTWGIPGGAVKELGNQFYSSNQQEEIEINDSLLESNAFEETKEELGATPDNYTIVGKTDFKSGSFLYRTFICIISKDEKEKFTPKIKLNWENTEHKWFDLQNLPNNLHFGVNYSLNNLNDKSENNDFNYLPRQHYISPAEKSTNNYGYMNIQEMPAINQNEW